MKDDKYTLYQIKEIDLLKFVNKPITIDDVEVGFIEKAFFDENGNLCGKGKYTHPMIKELELILSSY